MEHNTLIVKFSDTAAVKTTNVVNTLKEITGKYSFQKAEPLFPDETDKNLSSIYIIEISENTKVQDLISTLNKDNKIDYVHIPADRK